MIFFFFAFFFFAFFCFLLSFCFCKFTNEQANGRWTILIVPDLGPGTKDQRERLQRRMNVDANGDGLVTARAAVTRLRAHIHPPMMEPC